MGLTTGQPVPPWLHYVGHSGAFGLRVPPTNSRDALPSALLRILSMHSPCCCEAHEDAADAEMSVQYISPADFLVTRGLHSSASGTNSDFDSGRTTAVDP
jgi:hypothetical protein